VIDLVLRVNESFHKSLKFSASTGVQTCEEGVVFIYYIYIENVHCCRRIMIIKALLFENAMSTLKVR